MFTSALHFFLQIDEINDKYLGPYVGLVCIYIVLALAEAMYTVKATWNSAGAIHLKMLHNIIRTPLRFANNLLRI